MVEFVVTLLASATVSTALAGLLVWLLKSWIGERLKNAIKHEYDAKLESHKAQLKASMDTEAERLKSALQVAAAEHRIRFERLHEKVADTLGETYRHLYRLRYAVANYTKILEREGESPRAERRKEIQKAMDGFEVHFRENKIYIPKETAKKIDEFAGKMFSITMEFMYGVEQGEDSQRDDVHTWTKVHKMMSKEVPVLFESLEDDIQALLGFSRY